jgi:parallel beta-helix repeat protein
MSLTKVTYSMITGAVANILDYGADPTGATDSTAAIQAAIAASKTVYIPDGTFNINGSSIGWNAVNDVTLFGNGWNSKLIRTDVGSVVQIQGCSRVVVRDLFVQGVKTFNSQANNIDILNCSFFSITGNYVVSSSRQGINVLNCVEGVVSNNHVTDSWQDGIMVRTGSRRVTVSNNVVWENGDPLETPPVGEGIHVFEAQEISIVGNTIKGNKDNGIALEGADYTTVVGNTIVGQVVSGISVNNGAGYSGIGAVITGNTIKENGAFGVVVTRVSDGILSDNIISENASEGIVIGISSNAADVQERWIIANNRVSNNDDFGILVNWFSSRNRISNNIVDQSTGTAAITINRAQCNSNIIHDNTITSGVLTDGGTTTRIYDNDFGQKLSGSATLSSGVATITFSVNMPSSTYVVALNSGVNETFYTFNKTVSGFEIRSSNGASTATVTWRIVDQKAS